MNTKYKILLLTFLGVFITSLSYSQCKSDECVSKIGEGYTFLKTYQMEQVGDHVEYSYVFSKDTDYMLVICDKDGSSQNVVVTLLDSNKKEIASNFDKKANKHYPAMVYSCKATGMYYLKFTFHEKPECCISVLAFKK